MTKRTDTIMAFFGLKVKLDGPRKPGSGPRRDDRPARLLTAARDDRQTRAQAAPSRRPRRPFRWISKRTHVRYGLLRAEQVDDRVPVQELQKAKRVEHERIYGVVAAFANRVADARYGRTACRSRGGDRRRARVGRRGAQTGVHPAQRAELSVRQQNTHPPAKPGDGYFAYAAGSRGPKRTAFICRAFRRGRRRPCRPRHPYRRRPSGSPSGIRSARSRFRR